MLSANRMLASLSDDAEVGVMIEVVLVGFNADKESRSFLDKVLLQEHLTELGLKLSANGKGGNPVTLVGNVLISFLCDVRTCSAPKLS